MPPDRKGRPTTTAPSEVKIGTVHSIDHFMGAANVLAMDSAVVLYDQMCSTIAECDRIEEVRGIQTNSATLERLLRQAGNFESERLVAKIRLRAERRVGELLREFLRATPSEVARAGGMAKSASSDDVIKQKLSPYAQALADHGISRQAASRFQAVADMPAKDFERALASPRKPTTSGLLRGIKALKKARVPVPQLQASDEAIWLWGRLRDFERGGCTVSPPSSLSSGVTDEMRSDIERLTPLIILYLQRVKRSLKLPEGFEEFWFAYPRKTHVYEARDTYRALAAEFGAASILKGARAYASAAAREGLKDRNLASAHVWLRAGRWEDKIPLRETEVLTRRQLLLRKRQR